MALRDPSTSPHGRAHVGEYRHHLPYFSAITTHSGSYGSYIDGAYGNFVLKYTPIFYVFYDLVFEIHGMLDVIYGTWNRFTMGFSNTVSPQLLYSYFTA